MPRLTSLAVDAAAPHDPDDPAGIVVYGSLTDGDSYSLTPGTWTIKTNFTGYRPMEMLVELTGEPGELSISP